MSDVSKSLSGRLMWFICYPESIENIENCIEMANPEKYAYALHDLDVDETTGELKKAHYHVLLQFENERKITVIASMFGIESNLIKLIKAPLKRSKFRYLIHLDSKDKYQYDERIIVSKGFPRNTYLAGSEDEEALRILEICNDAKANNKPWSWVIGQCAELGLYGTLRRGSTMYLGVFKYG